MSTENVVNARTGTGAAIGGLIGFICAGPLGAGIGALVGGGVAHASNQPNKGVMTPRRQMIYTRAMESMKNPADLQSLANAFAGEGFDAEAEMLRKRAALRSMPSDVKEKRRAIFRKAMASDNPDIIDQTAAAFQGEGALDASKALSDHAEAVRAAHAAGKSTKPMTGGSQEKFADKLAKAIVHFGPGSAQAASAAANLVRAKGKEPTPALVAEVLRIAASTLDIKAPVAQAAPAAETRAPSDEELNGTGEGDPGAVEAAEVAGEKEAEGTGAPEPTVVGPKAPKVEPPAFVEAARAADVGLVANEGNGMANEGAAIV
jgi:hypothetical protein